MPDLDEALRTCADAGFSGTVCVRRGGQDLLHAGYGLASRRWLVPVSTATRFDAASIGKVFTAVAVLQLVDAGRLALDERIGRFVDLSGTVIDPDITVRQLLLHRSGIADFDEENPANPSEARPSVWLTVPCQAINSTRDFLPLFGSLPPNFAPGTDFRYSNAGYVVLGLVIEGVTGREYREVVTTDVLQRCGLASSGFFDRREDRPDVAEGWEPLTDDPAGGWTQNLYEYPPVGAPDGGIHLTAGDLATFLRLLRTGEVLSPASTTAMLTPFDVYRRREDCTLEYGYALEFVRDAGGVVRSTYKDGASPGAGGIGRWYPDIDVDVAILGNAESMFEPVVDVVHDWLRAQFPEIGPSGF
ncbi:serine hydrolase [Nakamurella sp. YIM 132087]|uniref:Serine hydrolase n=1 Tax=Nakamurella alba TaxID=2665158 RepID=A0A7K1FR23_9ACTN|nr:serine hydrolase domain-containing protein [Nakamurella alba]MTD15693.1 serine hydrolase [Nakamurella alba]